MGGLRLREGYGSNIGQGRPGLGAALPLPGAGRLGVAHLAGQGLGRGLEALGLGLGDHQALFEGRDLLETLGLLRNQVGPGRVQPGAGYSQADRNGPSRQHSGQGRCPAPAEELPGELEPDHGHTPRPQPAVS